MRRLTLTCAALATVVLCGLDSREANAAHGFGLHIGGRNVHLDIGNPHGYGYRQQVAYRRPYSNPQWYGRYNTQRRGTHLDWHDTSHVDYIPGGYVRHYDHYDYVPGRHVWHQEGHWDVHRGGHHGGRH